MYYIFVPIDLCAKKLVKSNNLKFDQLKIVFGDFPCRLSENEKYPKP